MTNSTPHEGIPTKEVRAKVSRQRGRSTAAPQPHRCGWCGRVHGADEAGVAHSHSVMLRSRLRLQELKREGWRLRVAALLEPIPAEDLRA